MKKLLTILLSVVLILDIAPVFAYAADSANPAADVKTAGERLAEANAKLEQAQNAYNKYFQDDPQIEEKYLKAQNAVTEAEEALSKAETELVSAQAAYDNAKSTYNEKLTAKEQAQSDYDSALQRKNDKTVEREATAADFAAAQEEYDKVVASISDDPDVANALDELQTAKDEVAAAEANVKDRTAELEKAQLAAAKAAAAKAAADDKAANAKAAEKPYEDAVNEAQKKVDAAQAAKAAADTAVNSVQTEYNNASQAVAGKEAEIEAAENRASAAQASLDQAIADKQNAEKALATANSAKEKAQADKAATEAAIADYHDSAEDQMSAYDFFVWLSKKSDQSAAVKESAAVAARMLKNQVTSADLAKIENDGSIHSAFSDKSYAEIIGYTNIGQEGDATSWDNFKYALTLAGKGNEYRAKENLSALKLSSVMMAMGEINANYQSSLEGIEHTSAFLALENLAYKSAGQGYSLNYPSPVFKQYDPFDGWYTREKMVYDYLVEKNWDATASNLTTRQKNEIMTACGLSKVSDVQTGHYLTLTDRNSGLAMITTGFGYVNQASYKYKDGLYYTYSTEKYSHMFGFSESYAGGQDGITVDAYRNLVTTYETSIGDPPEELVEALNAAEAAIAKADADITAANNAISAAQTTITNGNNDLAAANVEIETKQAELSSLNNEKTAKYSDLQSAKSVQAGKITELETANTALTKAKNDLATKQQETAVTETEASEAAVVYAEKQAELTAAQKEKDHAEAGLLTAKETEAEKQDAMDSIIEEKTGNREVVDSLREARANYDDASYELETAEEALAAGEAALTKADTELASAEAEKNNAQQQLTGKTNAKTLAETGKTDAEKTLGVFSGFANAKAALESTKAGAESAQAAYDEAKDAADKAVAEEAQRAAEEARRAEEARKASVAAKSEVSDLKAVKGLKLKAAKGKITVKWKKASKKELKTFQGYEIQYTLDGTFTDYPAKKVGKKKASATLKKLLKTKKYQVRIRRYRDDVSVMHVSAWKTKKSKTK